MRARQVLMLLLSASTMLIPLESAPSHASNVMGGIARTNHGARLVGRAVKHARQPRFSAQNTYNWSGYVSQAGSYTHVSGRWRVPVVNVTADNRYSSTWVGIGGNPTLDLIQVGTESDSVGGRTVYYAWTEILPEPETFAFDVNPGDTMSVDIDSSLQFMFKITLVDETTGQRLLVSTPYPSLHGTAEWIHEAPTVNGQIAPLASTGNAVFDDGTANGQSITAAGLTDIVYMVDGAGHRIATPGGFDAEGDGFQVAYGADAPLPPGS